MRGCKILLIFLITITTAGLAFPGRLSQSNTSGIPHHYRVHPEYFSKDDHYFHTSRELLGLFWDAPLRHEPGEKFTYK